MANQTQKNNYERLKNNAYPGRGIIIGLSPDSRKLVQVYWIMGRSENSRNRVFEEVDGFVRTRAYDESKMKDPSLIIYYPAKHYDGRHIITNGDQTDTIYEALRNGGAFEDALNTRCYEPDGPNFTPRISGMTGARQDPYVYKLSILKASNNTEASCLRQYFNYEKGIPGTGHCIHTYQGDGNPLPSFAGEPYELELFDGIDDTLNHYWNALNEENRISLLVKSINVDDCCFETRIVNRY
jgi:hypothetical protein